MSNDYTQLSFMVCREDVGEAVVADLHKVLVWPDNYEPELPDFIPEPLRRQIEDFGFGVTSVPQGDDLWINGEENPCTNLFAEVISAVLEHHNSDAAIGFEWANTCSRPECGAFGGGVTLVTKDTIISKTTSSLLDEYMEQHKRELAERG